MSDLFAPEEVLAAARAATDEWDAQLAVRRTTAAYQAYERVRRQVLGLMALGQNRRLTGHAPSNYWSGELAKFEDVTVVAICDSDDRRLRGAGRRAPGASPYADHRKLLSEADALDAVVIATPTHQHRQVA